jgi:hypothetical protein
MDKGNIGFQLLRFIPGLSSPMIFHRKPITTTYYYEHMNNNTQPFILITYSGPIIMKLHPSTNTWYFTLQNQSQCSYVQMYKTCMIHIISTFNQAQGFAYKMRNQPSNRHANSGMHYKNSIIHSHSLHEQ